MKSKPDSFLRQRKLGFLAVCWYLAAFLLLTLPVLTGCSLITSLLQRETEANFAVRSEKGYGVMNCKGEWLIEPIPKMEGMLIGSMSDGWVPILLIADNEYSYINKAGELISKERYDYALPFSEGLAAVRVDEEWGFINTKGEVAISPRYLGNTIGSFKEGLANVGIEANNFGLVSSWIFIDKQGKKVLGPYLNAGPFSDGYASVTTFIKDRNFQTGFIDKEGSFVLAFDADDDYHPSGSYGEGLFPVIDIQLQLEQGICSRGYMDKNGDWVIEPQYCVVGPFHDGLAPVSISATTPLLWGAINKEGEMVIPAEYETIDIFSGGCSRVIWDGFNSMGLINTQGEMIYQYGD